MMTMGRLCGVLASTGRLQPRPGLTQCLCEVVVHWNHTRIMVSILNFELVVVEENKCFFMLCVVGYVYCQTLYTRCLFVTLHGCFFTVIRCINI